MSQRLVTIATFSFPQEAYIFKTKLESQGIKSYVADEYIVTMMWLYSTAVGGVKLKVREADKARALRIISKKKPIHVLREKRVKKKRTGLSYYLFAVLCSVAEGGWTLVVPIFLVVAMLAQLVEWLGSKKHGDTSS